MHNLKQTEFEIFKYIFYDKKIEKRRVKFLEDDVYYYEKRLLNRIKDELSTNLPMEVKVQIGQKVNDYEVEDSVFLRIIKKDVVDDIAKDTGDGRNITVSTATFTDPDNIYLVRLINYKYSSRIFVFSRMESLLKNYILIVHPTNEVFSQNENILSIEIDHVIDADSMELKFN